MYVLIQFTACFFLEGRRAASVAYGIAVVFSSILLASVKPSFVLVAIVALLPVGIFFFRRDWFWQKMALGGGAAVSGALLLLPEHFLSRNDQVSHTFLPTTLFVIHANLIRDQIADDLQQSAKIPYPRDWLRHVHTALGAEIAKSFAAWPEHFSTLGLDPDYLWHNQTSIVAQLQKEFGSNVSALCAFYRFYYWRIWRKRPVLVVKKIVRQMSIFYAPMCPAYNRAKALPLTNEYNRGVTSLDSQRYRQIWTAYWPAVGFISRTQLLARNAPVVQQRGYIRKPLGVLAATYLPLLLIALALSAVAFMQEERRRRLGWLAALVLFVYSYNLASCLEVAVIQTLQYPRFVTVQMYFSLLAQFFALWFILELALEMRARQKHRFLIAPLAKDITAGVLGSANGGHNQGGSDHTISARFCSEQLCAHRSNARADVQAHGVSQSRGAPSARKSRARCIHVAYGCFASHLPLCQIWRGKYSRDRPLRWWLHDCRRIWRARVRRAKKNRGHRSRGTIKTFSNTEQEYNQGFEEELCALRRA